MPKSSGHSTHRCHHLRREVRRENAEARQAERNKRTPDQQLRELDKRQGNSTNERERLLRAIEKASR